MRVLGTFGFNGNFNGKMTKKIKWPKITFLGSKMVPKVSKWGFSGGDLYWKVVLEFWFGHPKCHFRYPQNSQKHPKWPILGVLGGTENGTWVAQIKILRPLFNTNTPPKPPKRYLRNPNRTSKSDFWPFYWFWSFSHWNSHWSQKKLRTAEGVVLQQKQKVFRNLWTKWNNLKPCRS